MGGGRGAAVGEERQGGMGGGEEEEWEGEGEGGAAASTCISWGPSGKSSARPTLSRIDSESEHSCRGGGEGGGDAPNLDSLQA